jgi:hypothetical protein
MLSPAMLCLSMLASTTSCLVTDSPEFAPPDRTRPLLLASDLLPTTEVLQFELKEGAANYTSDTFIAQVLSEDAGQDLEVVLLTDYGSGAYNNIDGPWAPRVFQDRLDPGHTAQGPREVTVPYQPDRNALAPGCHTVTMLVTHRFAQEEARRYCPEAANDFDTLTWFISLCREQQPGEVEPDCPLDNCLLADSPDKSYCGTANDEETTTP